MWCKRKEDVATTCEFDRESGLLWTGRQSDRRGDSEGMSSRTALVILIGGRGVVGRNRSSSFTCRPTRPTRRRTAREDRSVETSIVHPTVRARSILCHSLLIYTSTDTRSGLWRPVRPHSGRP